MCSISVLSLNILKWQFVRGPVFKNNNSKVRMGLDLVWQNNQNNLRGYEEEGPRI